MQNLVLLIKKEIRAYQRAKSEIQAEREGWCRWRRNVNPEKLIFIDETGIRTNCASRYGGSKSGEPCMGHASASWKSVSLIAAIRLNGVGVGSAVKGAFNKASFMEYMEENLLPSLKHVDIVILDNLSIHKNSFNAHRFKRRGIEVKYLPRYRRALNPIENMWSKVNKIIWKMEQRNEDEIWYATNEALWSVTLSNIAGWFHGCGYLH